ncbi:MAG: CsbD family protein [Bradyrhizobium sp.]
MKETDMDKEHVKGAADKAKGAIKDAAGKVADDKELQAEGKADKAKGALHKAAGDVKDSVKRGTE